MRSSAGAPPGIEETVEPFLAAAVARVDEARAVSEYREQDELYVQHGFLPEEVVRRWDLELESLRPRIHRNFIPKHKKGGSVIYDVLAESAPTIDAVYRSAALLGFLRRLFGEPVDLCPRSDPHRCALYAYTEVGDHMGFHYDTSYYRGKRYTLLLGLRDNSSSRLVCHLYTKVPSREKRILEIETRPGTLVAFNGDRLWHSVTPTREGEQRFVVTMEYVTSASMNPFLRFVSNMKDAIAYFGFREVFLRRLRPRSPRKR
jgi:hypothetical protein